MAETLEVVITTDDFKNSHGWGHSTVGGDCPLINALRREHPGKQIEVGAMRASIADSLQSPAIVYDIPRNWGDVDAMNENTPFFPNQEMLSIGEIDNIVKSVHEGRGTIPIRVTLTKI